MELDELTKHMDYGKETNLEILGLFMDTARIDLADLESAVKGGDAGRTAAASHSIKGAAASLGFMDIYQHAKAIEEGARGGETIVSQELIKALAAGLDEIVKAMEAYRLTPE